MPKESPQEQPTAIALDEFVKDTIVEVFKGVSDAHDATREYEGQISHRSMLANKPPDQSIEFDVALASTGESAAKAGIGVFLPWVGVGAADASKQQDVVQTRIKFSVPVRFPWRGTSARNKGQEAQD